MSSDDEHEVRSAGGRAIASEDAGSTREVGAPQEARTPWSQIAGMMGHLHSEGVSRGERAELRRMRRDGVPPEVYWRLTDGLTWPAGGPSEVFDDFWIAVLPLMTRNEHRPRARPGQVLAASGVKPARVERWLRRDRETAWAEAPRLLAITKGAALDWTRLALLLWQWDDPKARRRFARDYFRAVRSGAAQPKNDEGGS